MGSYLGTVWKFRYFWMSLVRMDVRDRYRGSVLGVGWSLLTPLAMTAILAIVFSQVFHQDIRQYAPRLLGGLATWQFLVRVTLLGCQCFFRGQPYIRAHPLPVAVFPLRTALGETFHFLVSLLVVVGMSFILVKPGFHPLALLSLVPTVILLFLLAWSLATLAGFANVYFQDTQHIAEIMFQLWFYATPIIYPPEVLTRRGMGWLLQFNPAVPFLDLIRKPILEGVMPPAASFGLAMGIVAITVSAACFLVYRLQRKLIFQL